AINSGHTDGRTADMESGHSGHPKKGNSKNLYRNRRRDAGGAGHPHKALRSGPEFGPYRRDDRTGLYPHELAHYEIDMVQFVLIDRTFRDILLRRSKEEKSWQAWENRGLTWIRVEDRHLTLQVGKSTVTFYSDDPGDMSGIAAWARETFQGNYDNVESLVSRIRYPQSLSQEELCVIITDPAVISNIRVSIEKDARNGVYNLPSPNESDPALKIYERDGTMRVEFIATNHSQAVRAIGMRENLMNNLPRMQKIPGLFWEFVQKYYSALHHPIIVDTGGHEFLGALSTITSQFTDALKDLATRIPQLPQAPDPLNDMVTEVEALDGFDIDAIVKAFANTMKLERQAVLVYLAAWSAWAGRNFKGRVLKEDISKLLLNDAREPTPLSEIADAIDKLQAAGLMQRNAGYDVKFSPAGIVLARKLTAKREGVQ
ncbi:MAG: hypothetical protein Q8R70_03540, partial [Methanoregula sp.]|nr:hypothetical protein [Methanoregula sp.]